MNNDHSNQSLWSNIPGGHEDPVFRVCRLYQESRIPDKVLLGVGAYRDENGKPLVLESVRNAKEQLAKLPSESWTHEYLPLPGHDPFLQAAQILAFGKDLHTKLTHTSSSTPIPVSTNRLVSVQTLGGTGALRLAFEFIHKFSQCPIIYFSNPTWPIHECIAAQSSLEVRYYRYLTYDHDDSDECASRVEEEKKDSRKEDNDSFPRIASLDLMGMMEDLNQVPMGGFVVLQMCGHNPTGIDLKLEDWDKIAQIMKERNLCPVIDAAYQGLSGDLDLDAASLRLFVDKYDICPFVACSFSKNMGLYGERVGALHVVTPEPGENENIGLVTDATKSQLTYLTRNAYGTPPQFGALLAQKVMTQPHLSLVWRKELKDMANRIKLMRTKLREYLELKIEGSSWRHITEQVGMFTYPGLTSLQVKKCTELGLFMLPSGRMSMAGLNDQNVEHAANIIAKATRALSN